MTQNSASLQGPFLSRNSAPLSGAIAAPGDKSISHRAFIFGALAKGYTQVSGLLESDDVLNTGRAMEALGAKVQKDAAGRWSIEGCSGKFESPATDLDFGNAGTGVRLVMGLVAGSGIGARFIGDESLSGRPMRRVTDPLSDMGADVETTEGRLPVTITPSELDGLSYAPPVASAQVKSAILLAGLGANGETEIIEAVPTRDHTETMLKLFGAAIEIEPRDDATHIRLTGPQTLTATDIAVPGDPSSAAFATIAALITPGSEITITGIMDNPARNGLYTTLKEMGADLDMQDGPVMSGEKTFNLTVRHSALNGIEVPAERAPAMIDEYPILAVAAAFASGTTHMPGLAELRAKESDRLAGTALMLANNGVIVEAGTDSLTIHGGPVPGGGEVETHHDHRLAMSGLVLGLGAQAPVRVDDASMIATSYPEFLSHMAALGAKMEPAK
ncbi:MAG: 3-phosphoshikimate 1-carboxyvinyltransferase [Alphaproteobacteria bacterium]|nr:3-phosphoshikimate 1-carboxyvinyltransferase [Alphaproteobacteria bacterium]